MILIKKLCCDLNYDAGNPAAMLSFQQVQDLKKLRKKEQLLSKKIYRTMDHFEEEFLADN